MSCVYSGEEWPKRDPLTGRELCHSCWNTRHHECGEMYNADGEIQCDHFRNKKPGHKRNECGCQHECDCVHLSEQTFADEEKAKCLDNRRAKKKLLQDQLKTSPLRAENPKFDRVPMV